MSEAAQEANRERQRRMVARMKARGRVRISLWVPAEKVEAVRAAAVQDGEAERVKAREEAALKAAQKDALAAGVERRTGKPVPAEVLAAIDGEAAATEDLDAWLDETIVAAGEVAKEAEAEAARAAARAAGAAREAKRRSLARKKAAGLQRLDIWARRKDADALLAAGRDSGARRRLENEVKAGLQARIAEMVEARLNERFGEAVPARVRAALEGGLGSRETLDAWLVEALGLAAGQAGEEEGPE